MLTGRIKSLFVVAGAALMALAGTSVGHGSATGQDPADASVPAAETAQAKARSATPVPPVIAPYMGMWKYDDMFQSSPDVQPALIERYLLLAWWNGKLRYKTYDYVPERRVRGAESDWKGTVKQDRWNTTQQLIQVLDDGRLSYSISGTNGVGAESEQSFWWAAGFLELVGEGNEKGLRLVTTMGYGPSSKGNAWLPMDRTYRLSSPTIDPEFLPRNRRQR